MENVKRSFAAQWLPLAVRRIASPEYRVQRIARILNVDGKAAMAEMMAEHRNQLYRAGAAQPNAITGMPSGRTFSAALRHF